MKNFLALFLSLFFIASSFAQPSNFLSRSELGLTLGQMYYIGDLNPFSPFKNSQWAGGLMYRYNIHSRMAMRISYLQGRVEANDNQSNNALLVNRNLNFNSDIKELSAGVEFYYAPFVFGQKRSREAIQGTAYLLAQLGMFYMNPKTEYQGDNIELRPLGTEGQGSSLNKKGTYSNYQLCVPLGVGAKIQWGKNVTVNLDLTIRKTFTDYLDDVGSSTYVNPALLEESNGSLAAVLSNRTLDGSIQGYRGNPSTKDWYVYAGMMVGIRLGRGPRCTPMR